MNADDFNKKELEAGRLSYPMVTDFTKSYQAQHNLKVDGFAGDVTQKAWLAEQTKNAAPTEIGGLIVSLAKAEIGNGESGRNNAGPDVVRFRGGVDDEGPWCADFVSDIYLAAIEQAKLTIKFKRKRGALLLYKHIGTLGSFVTDPKPGDVFCIKREGGHHIGIVEFDVEVTHTIEGNMGKFPSKVRQFTRDFTGDKNFIGFASLSK